MLRGLLIVASLATMLGACKTVVEQPSARIAHATLEFADGSPAGTAHLIGQGDRIDISAALTGLREGVYGLRLRETGDCEGADFSASGGPVVPGGTLPDAIVNASGSANVSATLQGTQMRVMARILDRDGTAIIVQQEPGGQRRGSTPLACGVFSRD